MEWRNCLSHESCENKLLFGTQFSNLFNLYLNKQFTPKNKKCAPDFDKYDFMCRLRIVNTKKTPMRTHRLVKSYFPQTYQTHKGSIIFSFCFRCFPYTFCHHVNTRGHTFVSNWNWYGTTNATRSLRSVEYSSSLARRNRNSQLRCYVLCRPLLQRYYYLVFLLPLQ